MQSLNFSDRSQVEDACQDVEGAANKFQALITSLKEEIQARKLLLTALDQADKFYRGQRKDVKKVVYVRFTFSSNFYVCDSTSNSLSLSCRLTKTSAIGYHKFKPISKQKCRNFTVPVLRRPSTLHRPSPITISIFLVSWASTTRA